MPPVTYYADTSRLNKPWRQKIHTLATAYGRDPNVDPLQDEEDEENQNQTGNPLTGILNRTIGQTRATTAGLRPGGPTSIITAGPSTGFSNPFRNQLQQISKLGTTATDIVRARNAYRAAQNSGGGGGGSFPNLGNIKGARAKMIAAARSQLGVPYRWGGEQPGRGFDCSGLVQWAYGRAGIKMPRVAAAQMTRGRRVPISKLQPGDLVGWGSPAHHIAIYLGGGRILEAPYTGARVRYNTLSRKSRGAWGIHLNV